MEPLSPLRKPQDARAVPSEALAKEGVLDPLLLTRNHKPETFYQSLGRCRVLLIFARCFLLSIIFTFCP